MQPNTEQQKLWKELFEAYPRYKEDALDHRRFKFSDILALINDYYDSPALHVKALGKSVEGRDIFQVRLGKGKTKVLLWSQMHGNEATATMAFFDLLKFFISSDEFDDFKEKILDELSLYFIPMLNPDGAERFQRRNALGIDINRDATTLLSPESRILKKSRDNLQPDFAFNMHDQNKHIRVGNTPYPAAMSFVAPAYDEKSNDNKIRQNAKKLIVQLAKVAGIFIPERIARYGDDFDPRCFGDTFQKAGTSTILIESGGCQRDLEGQFLRKLNFVVLLSAFHSIANGEFEKQDIKEYRKIHENQQDLFDLIIRNVRVDKYGKKYPMDIGIMREEENIGGRHYFTKSKIEDMGDLSVFNAYKEVEGERMHVVAGKIFPDVFHSINSLRNIDLKTIVNILSMGYTTLRIKKLPYGRDFSRLPFHVIQAESREKNEIEIGATPNFVIRKRGEVVAAVINGFYYDLSAFVDQD